jgi:hypothetical protein
VHLDTRILVKQLARRHSEALWCGANFVKWINALQTKKKIARYGFSSLTLQDAIHTVSALLRTYDNVLNETCTLHLLFMYSVLTYASFHLNARISLCFATLLQNGPKLILYCRGLAHNCLRTSGLTERSHVSSLYNFGKDRIEITTSNSSSVIVCLFLAAKTFSDHYPATDILLLLRA